MGLVELRAGLTEAFPPSLRSAIVREYRQLYAYLITIYDTEQGWDAQGFGFMAYKAAVARLSRLAADPQSGLTLLTAAPTFRLQAGPFLIASYRVGSSETESIDESYPRNENGAVKLADLNQLSLEIDDFSATNPAVIIAHLGNPITGLEAIYLAVPAGTNGTQITTWYCTDLLWKRSDGGQLMGPEISGPPPVPIPDATVRLRLVPTDNEIPKKDAQ